MLGRHRETRVGPCRESLLLPDRAKLFLGRREDSLHSRDDYVRDEHVQPYREIIASLTSRTAVAIFARTQSVLSRNDSFADFAK